MGAALLVSLLLRTNAAAFDFSDTWLLNAGVVALERESAGLEAVSDCSVVKSGDRALVSSDEGAPPGEFDREISPTLLRLGVPGREVAPTPSVTWITISFNSVDDLVGPTSGGAALVPFRRLTLRLGRAFLGGGAGKSCKVGPDMAKAQGPMAEAKRYEDAPL